MTDNNNPNPGPGRVSIWPTVFKFGLIIAAFRVAYNLLLFVTGLAATTGPGLVGIIGAIVLLVVALKRFRGSNGGYVSFGQAFGICFVASVIATVVRATVDTIYLAVLGQEFLAAQRDAVVSQVAANPAMDPRAMEAVTGFFDAMFTPGGLFILAVVTGIVGWFVLSLILAAFLKKPPPLTD